MHIEVVSEVVRGEEVFTTCRALMWSLPHPVGLHVGLEDVFGGELFAALVTGIGAITRVNVEVLLECRL